jgi:hypothetical protein
VLTEGQLGIRRVTLTCTQHQEDGSCQQAGGADVDNDGHVEREVSSLMWVSGVGAVGAQEVNAGVQTRVHNGCESMLVRETEWEVVAPDSGLCTCMLGR